MGKKSRCVQETLQPRREGRENHALSLSLPYGERDSVSDPFISWLDSDFEAMEYPGRTRLRPDQALGPRRFESRLQLSANTSRFHGNGVLRPAYWCVGVRRVRSDCYPGYVNGELNFLGLLDPEACHRISQETDATRMGGLGTTNVRLARVCQSPHFTLDQGSNLKPFEP